MEPAYFSLGPKGIITDPMEILRACFASAYTADAEQSALTDEVFSFQDFVAQYGHAPAQHIRELEAGLKIYFGKYFPEGVTVIVSEVNPGQDARYTLDISVRVTKDGKDYELKDALSIDPDNTLTRLKEELG
jgi:hypothetical protein